MLVRRCGNPDGYTSLRENLSCDPLKGHCQPLLQPDRGFPTQYFTQASIVAVPTTHALRSTKVVSLRDPVASDPRHHVDQLINRYEFIRSQIKRVAVVRSHDPDKSFHTIIHIHRGACLLAITPHFDLAVIFGESHLATDGGWRFFLFKLYQSQMAVVEKAIEKAALMLGTDKSRGYCLEMICADFLAGANPRAEIQRRCCFRSRGFSSSCPR
jgi:hypothetical protein